MRQTFLFLVFLTLNLNLNAQQTDGVRFLKKGEMPELPPIPEIPPKKPAGSVQMGRLEDFPEVQLDIPITEGPFRPSWESIEQNYPGTPQWLRDAKVGIWAHVGPQAAGESGDWYAQRLYNVNDTAYRNHLKRFGHPSEVGYKDVLHSWNPEKFSPEYLTKLYKKAGARFLILMGVHHDNFDLWNSQYQPWNAVNIGPHRDLLGEWVKACRKNKMRYGVTFHHEYTWWWWQTSFRCDQSGDKAGVPYDGNLTLADGKGKWWEGYDPRRLYGIDLREYKSVDTQFLPDPGIFVNHLDYARWYATQWALRIMDVTAHYDPDFIYTDGCTQGPFHGDQTGAGYKCNAMPLVMADFYNRALKKHGKADVFSVVKFRRPTNGTVTTAEFDFPDHVDTSQTWIREEAIGGWFFAPGFIYDPGSMIHFIIEAVCRDGCCALNIPVRPDGSLEEPCVSMLTEVGRWMDINGKAIYGSKAWVTLGEGQMENGKLRKLPGGHLNQQKADFKFDISDIRFTEGKDGSLYAFCMEVPKAGQIVKIKAMGKAAGHLTVVNKVKLLGHKGKLSWRQTDEALEITYPSGCDLKTSAVFQVL